MKKDFIPGRNSNLHSFVVNFIDRLDKHSAELSLNGIQVQDAKKILENYRNAFTKMISLKAESKSATEDYYAEKEKSIDLIRRMSNQIKSSHKYSKAFGEDFMIINRYKPVTDFSEHKPILKAKVNAGRVIIKFTRKGTDGIKLFSKTGNENEFSEIAFFLKGAYTDKRPKLSDSNPEARQYYALYVSKDKIVGHKSDVIKVIIP